MQKLITKTWKILIKKESLYLQYWNENNLHGKANSKKLPANNFEWIEDISKFNKDFIKNYNEESAEVLQVDVKYLEKLYKLHNDLSFFPKSL